MAIMIERQGTPVLLQQLLYQEKVACCIFFLAEDRCCQCAGGIIDSSKQTQPGAAIPKPGMPTAIDLHQHPLLGIAHPAAAMLSSTLLSRGSDPCRQQDATHAGASRLTCRSDSLSSTAASAAVSCPTKSRFSTISRFCSWVFKVIVSFIEGHFP